MRRLIFPQILIFLLLSIIFQFSTVEAQMPQRGGNQVSVTGWADDTHYLVRSYDQDKKLVLKAIKNRLNNI